MVETSKPVRLRQLRHLGKDLLDFGQGRLDWASLKEGYRLGHNPVEVTVKNSRGKTKAIRRTHNARTNAGGNWQFRAMASNVGFQQLTTTGLSVTSTTLVDTNLTGSQISSNQFQYSYVVMNGYVARINSHGGAGGGGVTYTLDGWWAPSTNANTSMTATSATPTIAPYVILPGSPPAYYFALSQTLTTVSIQDATLPGEVVGSGLSRALATYAYVPLTGSGSVTASTAYILTKQWQASGTVTVKGAGMFTSLNGGALVFESTFQAANLNNSDVLSVIWTINL